MIADRVRQKLEKGSPIRNAFERAQRLKSIYGEEDVFDFSIGNPAVSAPAKVEESIRAILDQKIDGLHRYMDNAGYEEARISIADALQKKYVVPVDKDSIIMTMGAAGALTIALCALIDPGDEVIVLKPYYPPYADFIRNWGGSCVAVECGVPFFQPDLADFEAKINERTKAVIVNSPNNPTGVIYTMETVRKMAQILRARQRKYGHEIYLLSDEPYRELVYTDTELPCWMNEYDNTLMIYSFSKSLAVPGERIGYLAVSDRIQNKEKMMKALRMAMGIAGYVNAPAMFQRVAAACAKERVPLEFYRRNRECLCEKLRELGFDVVPSSGAFYLFIKTPGSEEEFLKKAEQCSIILVGGSAFDCPGYVRLSYCTAYDTVMRSLPAFEKLAGLLT